MLQRMVFMYSVHTSGRPLLIRVVIRYGFRDTKYFLAWGILSIRGICRKSCLEAKFPCQFRVFGGIPGTRFCQILPDFGNPLSACILGIRFMTEQKKLNIGIIGTGGIVGRGIVTFIFSDFNIVNPISSYI